MSRSALEREEKQHAAMMPMMGMRPMPGIMPGMAYVPSYPMAPVPVDEEEDREKKRNEIPITNSHRFNINQLLFERIVENDYFQSLMNLSTFNELIDEIYSRVTHVEPWSAGTGRLPSTAWCLLVKGLQLRLTTKQMYTLLNHRDSPYIRAIGFLYLRVAVEPKNLWSWVSDYIDDAEEFTPSADPTVKMTMGKYIMKILTEMNYYNTMLPRIPVPIERQIKAHLILFEDELRRADSNLRLVKRARPGDKVKAIYQDEENDPAWYEASINEVLDPEQPGGKPKVVVTFDGYGNQECVRLGQVDFLAEGASSRSGGRSESRDRDRDRDRRRDRSRSRDRRGDDRRGGSSRRDRGHSRDRDRHRDRDRDRDRDRHRDNDRDSRRDKDHRRDRSRSREPSPREDSGAGRGGSLLSNVMAEVTKRDRERSAAQGKDYAQRPASYKGSLSLALDRYTHRKKSRSRSPDRSSYRRRNSPPRGRRDRDPSPSPPPRRGRPANDGRQKYLRDRYGDASAN